VIFDCDLGHSADDLLAMAVLYALDGKNEARLLAISVSNPSLSAAAYSDAVGRFYAGPVSGAFNAVGRTLPVGLAQVGKPMETAMITGPLAKKNGEGKPLFPHGVGSIIDTADPTPLLRNALTAQQDGNIVVLVSGPATNIVSLMSLPGAKELITRKVRMLVFAGGSYPSGKPEAHIQADLAAARRLFAEWPTPVVAVGTDLSEQVAFPADSLEKDFAWSPAHPIVEAIRASDQGAKDIPAVSPCAALFAIKSDQDFFKRSAAGTITIDESGATKFAASAAGKHTYLTVDPAQRERVVKTLVELASAKPVPRQPRFRPPQAKPKPEAPKAQEVKPLQPPDAAPAKPAAPPAP
jgi:inosine-uridine nucleoside N-ribohydrolase